MVPDNYNSATSRSAYFPEASNAVARLWSREKLLHDLSDLGIVSLFEGAGNDPTGFAGYSTSKLWLRPVAAGVTTEAGTVRYYSSGTESDLANWPVLTRTAFLDHITSNNSFVFDNLAELARAQLAVDDYFLLRDTSAAVNKRIRAGTIVMGPENYDVHARHVLDGGSGDGAKITAAIAAAPIGATLHFPSFPSLITAPIVWNRQLNAIFHGTTWRGQLGASEDLLTIAVPAAGTIGGDLRRFHMDGLRWLWVSGGRDGVVFKKGATGIGMLRNSIRRFIGAQGLGAPTTSFAFKIQDVENHWSVIEDCEFEGRGISHTGADGWKIRNCAFTGNLGIYLQPVDGAFQTMVDGCTSATTELAVHIGGGQQHTFCNNSWEQSGLNTGAYDCQVLIYSFSGTPISRVRFADNFGGGTNVGHPIRIYSNVYDTIFEEGCTSNVGASGADVYIASATGVVGTQFKSTRGRGTRSSVDTTRPWIITGASNLGTETQGIWHLVSGMGLTGTWASGSSTSAILVCPHSKRLIARGSLTVTAGVAIAGDVIMTLPVGMRPSENTIIMGMSNSGSTPFTAVVNATTGVVTVNSIPGAASRIYLAQLFNFQVVARSTYDPVV